MDNEVIENSNNKKLLGINLDNRLGFDTHITNTCNRVRKKLYNMARISYLMNTNKRRMTMKAFIASEFGYCPLVWMFTVKLHEMALKILDQDYASSFTELLERDNSTTIHNKNIQLLAT